MASSSYCLVVIISLAVLLVSGSGSTQTSTTFIDAICQHVDDKAFCVQTLKAYPPAASATTTFQAAEAAIHLTISYAHKSANFAQKAAAENPTTLKKQFTECQDDFVTVITSLQSAAMELKESPDTANYDVSICRDSTTMVKNLVGKNTDIASKTVIMMTLRLEKLLAVAVGATVAVGG